jgi:hypothetical protein
MERDLGNYEYFNYTQVCVDQQLENLGRTKVLFGAAILFGTGMAILVFAPSLSINSGFYILTSILGFLALYFEKKLLYALYKLFLMIIIIINIPSAILRSYYYYKKSIHPICAIEPLLVCMQAIASSLLTLIILIGISILVMILLKK